MNVVENRFFFGVRFYFKLNDVLFKLNINFGVGCGIFKLYVSFELKVKSFEKNLIKIVFREVVFYVMYIWFLWGGYSYVVFIIISFWVDLCYFYCKCIILVYDV